jgi:sec-independent protein translocase protein TatC
MAMTLPDELSRKHTKSFLGHLEDLRRTALWCLVCYALGLVLAIPLAPGLLHVLKGPVAMAGLDPDRFLRVLQVTGGFSIAMRLIVWGGLLFSLPFLIFLIAGFVFPGLTQRERRASTVAMAVAVLLFAGGVTMGYYMTLPVAVQLMIRISAWLNVPCEFVELSDYVGFTLKLLIAFGLAFELPVVVLLLGSLGIVTSSQLREKRRHAIVVLLIIAMFLTPPDPITQVLMAAPMALLYEICIWVLYGLEKRRRHELA